MLIAALLFDAFSKNLKLVGTLQYGQSITKIRVNAPPEYRAVKFVGKTGDRVGALVHSNDGDAILWLTDGSFNVVAKNDDATPDTVDAHVAAQLPRNDTYFLIFREYYQKPATFDISLSTDTAPPLRLFTPRKKPH